MCIHLRISRRTRSCYFPGKLQQSLVLLIAALKSIFLLIGSLWLYKLRVGMQKVSTDGCFIGIKLRAFQLKVGDMIPEDSLGLWPWSAAHNSETSLKENERRDDFSVFKWTVGRLVA